jgi:hypothetical protein
MHLFFGNNLNRKAISIYYGELTLPLLGIDQLFAKGENKAIEWEQLTGVGYGGNGGWSGKHYPTLNIVDDFEMTNGGPP